MALPPVLLRLTYSSASLKPRPQPILQKVAELHCLSMQRKIVLLKVTNYWMYSPFNWFLKCTFCICYGWNRPYSPGWSWTCGFPNITSWNYRCVTMSGAWLAFYQEKHFPLKKKYIGTGEVAHQKMVLVIQVWKRQFNPQDAHGLRRGLTPPCCPLTSTCVLYTHAHMYLCALSCSLFQ